MVPWLPHATPAQQHLFRPSPAAARPARSCEASRTMAECGAAGAAAGGETAQPAARVQLPCLTPRAPPPLPPKAELGDLSTRSADELKALCRTYGLTVSGRKAQLVARLYGEPVPPGPPAVVRTPPRPASHARTRAHAPRSAPP